MIPKEYSEKQLVELNKRFGKKEGIFIFKFEATYNIFGQRAVMLVKKKCKNIPGFAPDFHIIDVCEIVINNFKDDSFYIQCHTAPPTMREKDWKEIFNVLNKVKNFCGK